MDTESVRDNNKEEEILYSLFEVLMYRRPLSDEIINIRSLLEKYTFQKTVSILIEYPERKALSRNVGYPPGHFYSALVNVQEVMPYMSGISKKEENIFNALNLSINDMSALWEEMASYFEVTLWDEKIQAGQRYYYNNSSYPFTDALVYSAMLQIIRPKRIIEVGSGFSSAVLLDTQENFLDYKIDLTFIQPYPHTINNILLDKDWSSFSLLEKKVQDVELSVYDQLEAGDILFIDSTHVVKTGSDVVHEIIEILPRLNKGVLVHFHDIFYPFEYPDSWVRQFSRSWNEIYMLRAYLQDNSNYRIIMFNNYYVQKQLAKDAFYYERFLRNPGGSLWIERIG